jgi:hypothetical protein
MTNLVVSEGYDVQQIKDLLDSFENAGESIWKKRNTLKIFALSGREVIVKSFKVPHLVNRFAYRYLRKSKARRSYEHARILRQKGILTPDPIGYREEFSLIGLGSSQYISAKLDYDFDFNALYDAGFENRDRILEKFTEFTFQLHERGIHHLDHSRGNTLIVKRGEDQWDFYLVDLNRMRFETMDYQKRMDNFSRLGLTPDMIEIVSRAYAKLIGEDVDQVRADITASCNAFDKKKEKKKNLKKKLGRSS